MHTVDYAIIVYSAMEIGVGSTETNISRFNEGYNCSSRYDLYSAGETMEVAKNETGDCLSTAKSVHTFNDIDSEITAREIAGYGIA